MVNKPLISIIIPVYNVEDYLKECMDSVISQTYSNLDIILVDDGSRDGSGKLCDRYAEDDRRIQVLHKENGGLMSAWMAGVERARGKYLAFVDSDDWIEPEMIEKLAAYLSSGHREIICSNYLIEKKSRSVPVIQAMPPGVYGRKAIEKELFCNLLGEERRKIHSSRCMKLISKELIVRNLGLCNDELTMGEDLNIIFPAILDAERIVIVEKGLFYHYRFVDASMAHKYDPGLYDKIHLLYNTLKKIIEEKEITFSGAFREDIQSRDGEEEIKRLLKEGLRKEYIFLLFLVLKNELRGPAKGCGSRIKRLIQKAKEQEQLENVRVEISEWANKLLYFIWKKPVTLRIMLGRLAIKVFDEMS